MLLNQSAAMFVLSGDNPSVTLPL